MGNDLQVDDSRSMSFWALALISVFVFAWAILQATATEPALSAGPLISQWSFDHPAEALWTDSTGGGHQAVPSAGSGVKAVPGLIGGAAAFEGGHFVTITTPDVFTALEEFACTVWVRPVRFDRYNEIFRKEDGDNRLLFSFQEHGTILSLGLNVGGYVECDAPIDPALLLDGLWHHCAATFDGAVMRVFLDGREVGRLTRSGRLVSGGGAPACIGSSNGGECFQGAMDELALYSEAPGSGQIARLYDAGREAQQALIEAQEAALAKVYEKKASFVESLAGMRQRLIEGRHAMDPVLAAVMARRVAADFPEETRRLREYTGLLPAAYVQGGHDAVHRNPLARLVELMTEYRPLTEAQVARLTSEERQAWAEVDQIEAEAERLMNEGDASQFSPRWLELMLAAGARVHLRPVEREAVAPYVTPITPPAVMRTAEEARELLHRDWLHQADGALTVERVRQEIEWARALAARIERDHPGQVDYAPQLKSLEVLSSRLDRGDGSEQELYFAVRRVKRSIVMSNPVLDFDRVLMVDMPYPQGSEWRHETRHRLGYMAVPGGRLLVLDGLDPGGAVRTLMPQTPLHGSFWRPDVSFDGRKVLFCFKPHNEKSFHLYEINADGTELRQLTDGPYDDFDPVYLPDGKHIIFSTTRGNTYVRCMPPTNAFVLARADRDGNNIYLISRNNEPDYLPSVMPDGRVLYTRWEYTDKPLWRAQGLWTVNPDGTSVATLWGNQSVWPDLLKDARVIPGSDRVMFTGSAHHNWFAGSVGIIDPNRGHNFPDGLTKVTADVVWPECGNGPVDPVESGNYHSSGKYEGYYSPYPLSEYDFLVSAERGGRFVLYLMDTEGNRELVYEGTNHIFHAIPLRPRPRPRVIPDRVEWPEQGGEWAENEGLLYSGDVLQGIAKADELRGKVRRLRILTIDHKTYTYWNERPYLSTGPVVSAVQSEGVKRVLGTVPVEADGSVYFKAPVGIPLHFQLLDDRYRALQTMRSFTGVMPGERRGCLGCHEMHSTAPDAPVRATQALRSGPRAIEPPPWTDRTVSFERYVRPVLDRYCGECHQGESEGRKVFDMTPRTGFLFFDETYLILTGRPSWGAAYQRPENPPPGFGIANMLMVEGYDQVDPEAYRTPEPMSQLSYKSRLIEIASSGEHHDVKVDPVNLRRLMLWVDAMCPYRGEEEIQAIEDPDFQGIDWLAVRPRIKTAPKVPRP
jgi:hypothetical protein